MKKVFILMLSLAMAGGVCAQKQNVDQAKKMSGKIDKLEEARTLIKAAMADPSTKDNADTYYIAGKLEFDAFNKALRAQAVNPNDPSVDPIKMGEQLINGYNYYMQALPIDMNSEKPQFAKKMLSTIFDNQTQYYDAGATFYNNNMLPKAYDAFMIFGDIEELPGYKGMPNDSVRATSYYNAGLAAYFGNNLRNSAKAFSKARATNAASKETYIYEIACWQNIANTDSTAQEEAAARIEEIAMDGFKHFGSSEMLFLNNLVNSYMLNDKNDEALALINEELSKTPDNPALYGLLGFTYDRMNKPEESMVAYLKAVEFPNADFETLKNASKRLARTGTEKWGSLERVTPQAREEIKKYFDQAMEIAQRAKAINADDHDLNYVIENIEYALETYFTNPGAN